MENVKIWIDGIQKDVFGLFYIFNSKYYFVYTEKELDENDYVILYMTTVGKETKNTENGAIETGAMVGVEITNPEEQTIAQTAISYIVEDKKNNTVNPQIQYLPMTMLKELKIISKKRFRLLKSIMQENFKLEFNDNINSIPSVVNINPIMPVEPIITDNTLQPLNTVMPESSSAIALPQEQVVTPVVQNPIPESVVVDPIENQPVEMNQQLPDNNIGDNVIIDYRSKYFEEQEKNKELEAQIESLTQKLDEVKKIIS